MSELTLRNQHLEQMVNYLTKELEKKELENIRLNETCIHLKKNLSINEMLIEEYSINKSYLENLVNKQKSILKLQDTVFKLRNTFMSQKSQTEKSNSNEEKEES